MEDITNALSSGRDMIMMGGGNPANVPEIDVIMQQRLQKLSNDSVAVRSLLGSYDSAQGNSGLIDALVSLFSKKLGWPVTRKNIALTNGSQSAFFVLYNMFAGEMADGTERAIHLPLAPEYIGYRDIGLSDNLFTATRPEIELLDDNLFKYHVDFSRLAINARTAALCVSRPTNPTGNVLTDAEIAHLDSVAVEQDIPFIIDGAYGLPFPSIIFNDAKAHWNSNTILVLSLSKLGLPGVRTGIIVAREDIINAYTKVNTIVSLACGNLGPALARELVTSGDILSLSTQTIAPFYQQRADQTVTWFRAALGDLPYRIHRPEGAIFLWLWFEGLPITSQMLYERLKARGVLVVPGHNFFPGIEGDWSHKDECIRVSYAQDGSVVQRGVAIIAEEVAKAYLE